MTRRCGPLCGQHHRSKVHLPAGDSHQGIERGERPSVSNRPRTRRRQVDRTRSIRHYLPCRNCLAETDCPQVLGASRRAIACQAANKNHPEHPSPPGHHCRPGLANQHDIRSRRAGEAPACVRHAPMERSKFRIAAKRRQVPQERILGCLLDRSRPSLGIASH
jgi:hypothetical protein